MTIIWLVASSAIGGMVISRLAVQSGSSMPFVSTGCACNALPTRETAEKRISIAHGYPCPMPRVLNTQVAQVNASTGTSTISGNIQPNAGWMPQAMPSVRNASKLRTNAMTAMSVANAMSGQSGACRALALIRESAPSA